MSILNWFRREPAPPPSMVTGYPAPRDVERVRPTIFDCDLMPPIRPDLIPASSWGSSLHNLLTRNSWNSIRSAVNAARGNCCQLCGTMKLIQAHEIWAYSPPPPHETEAWGVQRLAGIASVCAHCHRVFHLGRENVLGSLPIPKAHLMALNRWDNSDFDAYYSTMARQWEARNSHCWALDLSLVARFAPFIIDEFRGWVLNEGVLTRAAPQDGVVAPCATILLGCSYVWGSEFIAAFDPAEAYDGLMPEAGDFEFVRSMGDGVTTL
jgi:hypothetical protein